MVSENEIYIAQSDLYIKTGTITWFRKKKKEKEHLKEESNTVKNLNVNEKAGCLKFPFWSASGK